MGGYQDGIYSQQIRDHLSEISITLHEIRDLLGLQNETLQFIAKRRRAKFLGDDTPREGK